MFLRKIKYLKGFGGILRLMEGVKNKIVLVCTGITAGLINGVFGGGGGMIVVPMLAFLVGLESKKAHATALIIILPVSIVSGLMYAVFGNFRLDIGIPVTVGVVAGGAAGAFLLKKLPPKWVVLIFAAVMLAAGVKMLFF